MKAWAEIEHSNQDDPNDFMIVLKDYSNPRNILAMSRWFNDKKYPLTPELLQRELAAMFNKGWDAAFREMQTVQQADIHIRSYNYKPGSE